MTVLNKTSTNKPPNNHLEFIATLRGLAALYVMSYHLALIPKPSLEVPVWMNKIILTGGTGVTLFFVVSAFTLTRSLRIRNQEVQSTLGFYTRRYFRIVPLFYVWILASWLRDKLLFGVTQSSGTVLLSIFFVFNLIPGLHQGFVWAGWTIGVEMLFYLMFPLIFYYIDDIWKAIAFFFATLILYNIFSYLVTSYSQLDKAVLASFLQFSILRKLPIFALGVFVYFIYERFIQNKHLPAGLGVGLVLISIFSYSALLDNRLQLFFDHQYWGAIIYGTFLLGLAISPASIIVNRLTRFYGDISYSFYLNHPTLIFLMIPVYRGIYSLEIPRTFQYGACFLITLILLTALSYATYQLIEKPGIRLGRKLIKNLQNKKSQSPTESDNRPC